MIKKGILGIITIATFSMLFLACNTPQKITNHKINGYNLLCMEDQGNQYDLEDKFNTFFAKIGFSVITSAEEEELKEEEKKHVLYATYACVVNSTEDGTMSNLTLTLRNNSGKIIFSSSEGGWSLLSPRRGFKKASDKIIKQIKDLNYSFDSTLVQNKKKTETDASKDTEKEEMIKMARDMKADGMSIEKIIKYTGLTEEEINKL